MTKRLLTVLFITVVIAGIIFMLVNISRQPFEMKHGFLRQFRTMQSQEPISQFSISNKLYVAGISNSKIYYHTQDPAILVSTDTTLDNLQTIKIPLDTGMSANLKSGFSAEVSYPYVYIFGYNISAILRYDLISTELDTIKAPANYTTGLRISDTTFIIKYFTGDTTRQSICRLKKDRQRYTTDSMLIWDDLSASGTLVYNSTNGNCTYIHQYSNNITVFDTTLHTIRLAHTIDTFTQSMTKYIDKKSTGSDNILYKPDGKRMLINYLCRLHNNRLYINSLLKADNEPASSSEPETVIDVYDANSDMYLESFYLPLLSGKKLQSFHIFQGKIIATYKNHIALYRLPS